MLAFYARTSGEGSPSLLQRAWLVCPGCEESGKRSLRGVVKAIRDGSTVQCFECDADLDVQDLVPSALITGSRSTNENNFDRFVAAQKQGCAHRGHCTHHARPTGVILVTKWI